MQIQAEGVDESRGLRDKAPIAAEYEDCLQAFKQVTDALEANPDTSWLFRIVDRVQDDFIAWGSRCGATSRLLDYSVRNSMKLAEHILRLLRDLRTSLKEGESALSHLQGLRTAPQGRLLNTCRQ
jgi:hypothetical protein